MDSRELVARSTVIHLLRKLVMRSISNGLHFGQVPILEYIIKNDACTQAEIAQSLHVSAASIAVSTKRMEKSGLITKTVDATSLRKNNLSATEQGKQLLVDVGREMREFDDRTFAGFSEEEKAELCSFYDRILFNITGKTPR